MIKKLFGQTEEEQYNYLQPKVIALGVGVTLLLIGMIFMKLGLGEIIVLMEEAVCMIVLFMFGWAIMKGLFGFATIGTIFSGNPIIGVVILVLFIMVGYLGGFLVALMGICHYLILLKKRKGNR